MCGADRVIITGGMDKDLQLAFHRKDDGSIGWLRLGYRINRRLE